VVVFWVSAVRLIRIALKIALDADPQTRPIAIMLGAEIKESAEPQAAASQRPAD
jgi:hypothetical protein